ncbi:hypothetical protein ACIBFB_24135 [Nocardiopsis sp. NPDC050513]|uniref:hypothetical protein n=1 Tax=Nocardiopsis sp. NPDC050513 TaxID=3364338 RepID=UPI0037A4BE9D
MTADDAVTSRTARRILDALLDGVDELHPGLAGRYPLFRRPDDAWVTSRRGSWTGGLWAGLLWLRALERRESTYTDAARTASDGLAVWAEADTAARGLVFWYPLALSRRVVPGGAAPLEAAAGRAARSLGARFSRAAGVIPWGEAFGGSGDLVRVDGAPGAAPLMCAAQGVSEAVAAAGAAHLERHLRLCWDGSAVVPVWRLDGGGVVRGAASTRYWSRGRAWLLTAFADAVRLGLVAPDDPALGTVLDADAPLAPPADTDRPRGPVDTGAAAIEAAALLRLGHALETPAYPVAEDREGSARVVDGGAPVADAVHGPAHRTGTAWSQGGVSTGDRARRATAARARAHAIVCALDRHHMGPRGLGQGSYEVADGLVTGIESVWGNFFLALAAAMVLGVVPADLI